MKDRESLKRPAEALSPSRTVEIGRVLVELLNNIHPGMDQNEAANFIYNLFQKVPELLTIVEFKAALTAGAARAIADSNAPLTAEQFTVLLQNSGLSQGELAEALGIAQPNISWWLNGARAIPQKHADRIRQLCVTATAKRVAAIGSAMWGSSADGQKGPAKP